MFAIPDIKTFCENPGIISWFADLPASERQRLLSSINAELLNYTRTNFPPTWDRGFVPAQKQTGFTQSPNPYTTYQAYDQKGVNKAFLDSLDEHARKTAEFMIEQLNSPAYGQNQAHPDLGPSHYASQSSNPGYHGDTSDLGLAQSFSELKITDPQEPKDRKPESYGHKNLELGNQYFDDPFQDLGDPGSNAAQASQRNFRPTNLGNYTAGSLTVSNRSIRSLPSHSDRVDTGFNLTWSPSLSAQVSATDKYLFTKLWKAMKEACDYVKQDKSVNDPYYWTTPPSVTNKTRKCQSCHKLNRECNSLHPCSQCWFRRGKINDPGRCHYGGMVLADIRRIPDDNGPLEVNNKILYWPKPGLPGEPRCCFPCYQSGTACDGNENCGQCTAISKSYANHLCWHDWSLNFQTLRFFPSRDFFKIALDSLWNQADFDGGNEEFEQLENLLLSQYFEFSKRSAALCAPYQSGGASNQEAQSSTADAYAETEDEERTGKRRSRQSGYRAARPYAHQMDGNTWNDGYSHSSQ